MNEQTEIHTVLDLLVAIQALPDGLHVFGIQGQAVRPLTGTTTNLPLLTSSGEPEELRKLVDCFENWDGELKIAALQEEGLLDVWAF